MFSGQCSCPLCVKMGWFQQKGSHGKEKLYCGCEAKKKSLLDPKSGTNLVLTRTLGEGNMQIRNQVAASKVASDSSSYSSRSTEEYPFICELRRDSSKQASGTPMKKVLAAELLKETESRRRPPSIIARLMGLDALPPQQSIHKQQKKFPENYLQRASSTDFLEKSSSYEGQSFATGNEEQQEFKDIFEVLETETAEKHSNLSVQKGNGNLKLSESKMDFIRQKFIDVKCLSTDKKHQQSKEFHDTLEVLDCNKELLVKFLQEPDSLFTKHLHAFHGGIPPPPQSGHKTVLKSSNTHNFENRDVCSKSERRTECKDITYSVQKRDHGSVSHSNKHDVHISRKVSKSQLDDKDEPHLPTRIVVLKPNLRKAQNTAIPFSSPSSPGGLQSSYLNHKEFQSSENLELSAEVWDRKNSSIRMGHVKHRDPWVQRSREIAKEVTRQMKHNISNSSIKLSGSTLTGYAGDESSYLMSGNDSGRESEVMTPTSRHFYDRKSRYSPSSSHSTESSVLREAKKRLSERWKMTHKYEEVGMVGRRSTLGEMLAMPDRETKAAVLDSVVGQGGFNDRLARDYRVARLGSPLGISSRDGWKDECARSLPRSRSLPASSIIFGSLKTSVRPGALGSDRSSMLKDSINWGSNKSENGDSDQREGSSLKSNSRYCNKKSHTFLCVGGEKKCTVQETILKPDKLRITLEMKGLSEPKPMPCELLDDDLDESIQITDAIAKLGVAEMSSENHEEQPTPAKVCITSVKDLDGSAYNPDVSIAEISSIGTPEESSLVSHCTETEADSSSNSKEAEQPSPVSVLELPFEEDLSSGSNSFERISADLHELRMQLQLLKQEPSDAYSEGSEMIVSSDEDIGEGSLALLREKREVVGMLRDEENRDFSYLEGMLVDSGFHDVGQDLLLAMCYSPECPVGLNVFDMLEKKYGEYPMWTRSERRLLFDRINLGLMEILQLHMDPLPWVKSPVRMVGVGWSKEPLTEELWKLLGSQSKEGSKDSLEILGKEIRWLDLRDDIDVVGREIEQLLIDDLVTEVVSM